MIFRVLGCSGSESDRNHPCSFLAGEKILVDMGSAASRLTIHEQTKITDVLLSHAHLDHTKDVAFFSENIFSRIHSPVTVRGTPDTIRKLNEHLLNNEIWPDFSILPTVSNSVLKYETFEPGKPLRLDGVEVTSVPVNHPGGCVGFLFKSATGTIVYSGDTGPTEDLWKEVNRRGKEIKGILLETSFPNRLQKVADVSGHHTPATMSQEVKKFSGIDCPIFVYHIKSPYREETVRELEGLDEPRLRILEAGMTINF
ncbi:MAG TPA: 3',5'-cyclic-nucleotide phosphodiesterase [Bdellovibrionota bacterium]|nr:3',5'-cyclic-nucleotide phosphodiesterase [Bdellovibrionota bacterium]